MTSAPGLGSREIPRRRARALHLTVACAVLTVVFAARPWATPSFNLTLTTLATAVGADGISEHVQIKPVPSTPAVPGLLQPWQLQMQVQGSTDYIVAHLTIPPGGHSGWHTHPGILVAGVQAGEIDFYDETCAKSHIGTGGVYTENNKVHGIYNSGADVAELLITFLVKHGAGRRLDAPAPSCASETPIP